MTLLDSILSVCRTRRDAGLPVAETLANSPHDVGLPKGWLRADVQKAADRLEEWRAGDIAPRDFRADYEAACRALCIAKGIDPDEIISDAGHLAWQHMGYDAKQGLIARDEPIRVDLAALRACRGDDSLLSRSPADDEALVQAVVSGVLTEFREQPTNRLRRKLGDGVRRGLRRAGVVRP